MALPNPKAYTMDAAGEQSYKNEVDRYNQANPNSRITYTSRATYGTTPNVVQKGNYFTVGDHEFLNEQAAKSWAAGQGQYSQPTQNVNTAIVNSSASSSQPAQTQQVQQPSMTPEQLAEQDRIAQEGVVNKSFTDTNKVSDQYGLEKGPSSISEMVSKFKEQQAQELKYAQEQNERQAALDAAQEAKFQEQATGAKGATNASMAQGREGAVSGSAPKFASEFTIQMNKQIDENKVRLQSAQAARDQAMIQLANAQKNGQTELAEQIQGSLAAAEVEIQKAKTNYMNTLADFNKQALDTIKQLGEAGMLAGADAETLQSYADQYGISVQQLQVAAKAATYKSATEEQKAKLDGLTQLFNLAKGGAQLSQQEIFSQAKALKVDPETLMQYNSVAASKNQADQATARSLELKMEQEQRGVFTSEAQNVELIMSYYRKGDIESAHLLERKLGIDDLSYQAEIKLKSAQAEIARKQSLGIPITAEDRLNEAKALGELSYLNGGVGGTDNAFVPVNSQEGIKVTTENGEYQVIAPPDKEFQCGAFVNRTWGTGVFGDLGTQKMGVVDKRGFGTKGMSDEQLANMVKPGMAFVMPIANNINDHVGLVGKVLPTGIIAVEANADGKAKTKNVGPGQSNVTSDRFIPWSQMYGFVPPPAGTYQLAGKSQNTYNTYLEEAKKMNLPYDAAKKYAEEKALESLGGSGQSSDQIAQTIMAGNTGLDIDALPQKQRAEVATKLADLKQQYLKSGNTLGYLKASAGGKALDATAVQSLGKAQNVMSQLGGLEETINTMDTGPITNLFRSANPYDVDKVKLKAQLQAIVPNLARGVYGEVGVLTDNDIQNYIATLPNGASTEDQKKALLEFTKKTVTGSIENSLKNYAMAGYNVSGYTPILESLNSSAHDDYLGEVGGGTSDYTSHSAYNSF